MFISDTFNVLWFHQRKRNQIFKTCWVKLLTFTKLPYDKQKLKFFEKHNYWFKFDFLAGYLLLSIELVKLSSCNSDFFFQAACYIIKFLMRKVLKLNLSSNSNRSKYPNLIFCRMPVTIFRPNLRVTCPAPRTSRSKFLKTIDPVAKLGAVSLAIEFQFNMKSNNLLELQW